MPDYRTLYFQLFSATEQAIETLQAAQQAAEEAFCTQISPAVFYPVYENKEPSLPTQCPENTLQMKENGDDCT